MRLKYIITALLLAAVTTLSAQQYSEDYIIKKSPKQSSNIEMVYGVLAGVVLPKLSDKQDKLSISNKAGYGFAMMWGVDLGTIEVVPEIWYTHSNTDLAVINTTDRYELVSNTIEIPVIFSLPIAESGLRFNVGPTFALMSNSKLTDTSDPTAEQIDFGRTKSTAGYLIGMSLTLFERLILDCRFTGRYVSTEKPWHTGSESYDYRYYDFAVNVGYRF